MSEVLFLQRCQGFASKLGCRGSPIEKNDDVGVEFSGAA